MIVHAERPKLSPYKRAIAESIAGLVGLPPELVSVKAKTNEGLGPIGQGEAMACTAVVMIVDFRPALDAAVSCPGFPIAD